MRLEANRRPGRMQAGVRKDNFLDYRKVYLARLNIGPRGIGMPTRLWWSWGRRPAAIILVGLPAYNSFSFTRYSMARWA
jgi:hypothetical protein